MEYVSHYGSPLGGITLESDGEALTGLWFDDRKRFTDTPGDARKKADLPVFRQTKKWHDLYFAGKEPAFTPPLKTETTPFRRAVWEILLTIPYGKTATYGEIAKQIARQKGIKRMSSQAVGGAVGHNPIALIIPCHRVVGRNEDLVGYGGGIDRKAKLLALEKHDDPGRPGFEEV